ncbi:MAG TPA: glutamate racemase [Anaerolineae bacterium]|nr:glutamate racemase [Anaerolineae bacterium]
MNDHPIGIFDSGVGGLSVWREIARQLPHEDTLYFADQTHIPYGPRPMEQIRDFSEAIARFLLRRGCKAIVVACNTASAAALKGLRKQFPQVPFVGMEPAVKPAVERTQTRVVGVLATPATFQGALFASVVERFANGVQLVNQVCPGLVERIEAGNFDTPETDAMLRDFLQPILDANADTIVLACTHYPFVVEPIRRIVGPGVNVIDPSPAIARQTGRVLAERGLSAPESRAGRHVFCTSGERDAFCRVMGQLVNVNAQIEVVEV